MAITPTGYFFQTYKNKNSHFSPDTFRVAQETMEALLKTETSPDRPGMLLGKVQSGKTRTFISVLALAFDNGFDIAVVLTKNSKALMEQTAKRLKSEFGTFVDDGELEIYDIMHAPESFGAFELESKLVLVAKKQKDNLRRLIEMFGASPGMAAKRVLIIDDEADSASIGYVKKSGITEAKAIARQVNDLRTAAARSAYLQVTATPYSLYLQPSEVEVANVLTYKPIRPAFTRLVPVPPEYVGGETYFGESAKAAGDTLESLIHHTVDHREFDRLKKPDGRSLKLAEVLVAPQILGFRTAILNFLIGGCIQRINGIRAGERPKRLRYSFLLHSEAGKEAHEWQEQLTGVAIDSLRKAAQGGEQVFEDLVRAAYDDLARSIRLAGTPLPSLDVTVAAIKEALTGEHITIVKVNSDDDVAAQLDDSGQLKLRSPLNIFIGGQVLDRGVTLANLIGFYYGRRPQKYQQDTVLQHSRMYGYRRPDLPVTRFSTSKAIRHAMAQMEEFDSSLRATIESGGDQEIQFIRRAEDGSIVPCNPNKILVSTTQTLKPGRRILPIGFQTGYKTGAQAIGKVIDGLDAWVEELCGFGAEAPKLIPMGVAEELLRTIQPTMHFPEDDAPEFDWEMAIAALRHLSNQHSDPDQRDKVLLWAARDRDSGRLASESSHATYIETPDSEKTEGQLAKKFASFHPILFLLRQNGDEAKGWRGTPFYWPVIRAQGNAPTAIFTGATND